MAGIPGRQGRGHHRRRRRHRPGRRPGRRRRGGQGRRGRHRRVDGRRGPDERGGRGRRRGDRPRPAARPWPWPRTSPPLAGGERIVGAGVERWGRIDGVVAVAGILRERMLFNMAEDEWDAVIETHLKGHFTVFRAAVGDHAQAGGRRLARRLHLGCLRRQRRPGQLRGGQGRHRVAGALGRRRAPPLRRSRPTPSPRWPGPGCRPTSRWTWPRWVTPRTWRPWSSTCCPTRPSTSPGRSTPRSGPKIAVWNQPREVRAMYADGRWTPELIAAAPRLHGGPGAHAAARPARGLPQGGRGEGRRREGRRLTPGPDGRAQSSDPSGSSRMQNSLPSGSARTTQDSLPV